MAFKVNGIEYYHPQVLYSSHLEVVIICFPPRRGWWHFYGHSPAEWHDNPSAQRQLLASSLGEVCHILNGVYGHLGCLVGTSKDHLPHRSGDHVHISDSHSLILHNVTSAHCSHCGFDYCFWLQGCLRGSGGHWVPLQAGHHLLEAWGWSNFCRVSNWNKSSEFTLLTFTTFVPRPKKVKKNFFKIFGHHPDTPLGHWSLPLYKKK